MICSTTTPRALDSSYGPGRRRDEDDLAHALLPLLEIQRPVVERRRQAEAIGHQHLLARAVAVVHAADLRHGLMALVDDDQRVLRQVVEQRRRRIAGLAAGQVPRVVLDAVAVADLVDHLEIEHRALVQPLRLEQAPFCFEHAAAPRQFFLDRLDGAAGALPRGDEMGLRIDRDLVVLAQRLAGERVERRQRVDFIAEQLDSQRPALRTTGSPR